MLTFDSRKKGWSIKNNRKYIHKAKRLQKRNFNFLFFSFYFSMTLKKKATDLYFTTTIKKHFKQN